MKKAMSRKNVIAVCFLTAAILAAGLMLWRRGQSTFGFAEATGLDPSDVRITCAEYSEAGAGFSRFSVTKETEEALRGTLSSVRLKRGKRREAMPDQSFLLFLEFSDGKTTQLVVGGGGEIMSGDPGSRGFWRSDDLTAYRQLYEAYLTAENAG